MLFRKILVFYFLTFNFLFSNNNENLNDFKENVSDPIQKICNINLNRLMNDIESYKKKDLSLNNLIN